MNRKLFRWKIIFFLTVSVVFLALRLVNIEDRTNFSMDQGMFMLQAENIWKNKEITLIGPSASPTVEGRHFFQGPAIYYFLAGLGVIADWNPITIGWLMVFGGLVGWWFLFETIKMISGEKKAWIGATIFCFLPIAIEFSNFIWNPNILLIFTPIFLFFLVKAIKTDKTIWILVAGVMAGINLQFHFQFGPILLLSLIYLICKKKKWWWYFGGILIGYLPLIIFDLRNNFYNVKTIWQWIAEGEKDRKIMPYDFLAYIPVLILLIMSKTNIKIAKLIMVLIIIWSGWWVMKQNYSRWMPINWSYGKLEKTAEIIRNNGGNYNVVNLLSGDTRFYSLRYLLRKDRVGEVDKYSEADILWVVGGRKESEVINNDVYEIKEFSPKIIEEKINLNDGIYVYKLRKKLVKEKYATIVNPVRSRQLWKDKSLKPIDDQYENINKLDLKATWLVQNDVLEDTELVERIKKFDKKQELGLFLEVSENLTNKARIYYPSETEWYSPKAVFLSAYDPNERKKMIDVMMTDFKNVFGFFPKSVGGWWIDGISQQYLENKYDVTTMMIVADQKTTDNYGVWGQWWGVAYHPDSKNILVPGNSKTVVIQWAQRDWEKAYKGEGKLTSNYSLQANDYTSLGLNIKYFEKLATQYLESSGQITVGLETGMESVGLEKEYKKQLTWIKNKQINSLTMSEYGDIQGNINPEKIIMGDWVLTANYRENKKLGERTDYYKGMVFGDYFDKDESSFLNRIYAKDNLISSYRTPWKWIVGVILFGLIIILRTNIKLLGLGWTGLMILKYWRYSVIEGEKVTGFLVDNLRFVGIGEKIRFINQDLPGLVAKSMLKAEINFEIFGAVTGLIIIVSLIKKIYDKRRKNKKSQE